MDAFLLRVRAPAGEAATTSWPPRRSIATVFEPISPAPPITTIFMQFPFSFPSGGGTWPSSCPGRGAWRRPRDWHRWLRTKPLACAHLWRDRGAHLRRARCHRADQRGRAGRGCCGNRARVSRPAELPDRRHDARRPRPHRRSRRSAVRIRLCARPGRRRLGTARGRRGRWWSELPHDHERPAGA